MTDVASKINNILSEYLKGDKKRAYIQLKKISKKYPLNEKLKFNLAFIEQDQGNIEKAKKSYLELINKFDNFNSKINLYNIFLKEKNYLKSLDLIEDVLKIKSDLIDVWIDKAYINYKIKNYKLSKNICHSILSKMKNKDKEKKSKSVASGVINTLTSTLGFKSKEKEQEKELEDIERDKEILELARSRNCNAGVIIGLNDLLNTCSKTHLIDAYNKTVEILRKKK